MQDPTFGDNLKRIRLSKGDSVRKVALYAGISASYYSQIENNKRRIPKPATLRKIAAGLHLSENKMFKLAGLIPDKPKTISLNAIGVGASNRRPPQFEAEDLSASRQIFLANARHQLQLPINNQVSTQLPSRHDQSPMVAWLKVTDTNLMMLGILKNDLAIVDTTDQICQLVPELTKLVAVNLTSTKTSIRRALLVTDDQVMLTTGLPTEKPVFLSLTTFKTQLVGAVINLYRDLH